MQIWLDQEQTVEKTISLYNITIEGISIYSPHLFMFHLLSETLIKSMFFSFKLSIQSKDFFLFTDNTICINYIHFGECSKLNVSAASVVFRFSLINKKASLYQFNRSYLTFFIIYILHLFTSTYIPDTC